MRYIKFILSFMIVALGWQKSNAYDFMVDGLCYNINNDGTSVTVTYKNSTSPNYLDLSGALNIPIYVSYNNKTYSVTSIGYAAFENCTALISVTIPNSVTSIGNSAFSGCTGLTSVTIPNSVTSIGGNAFGNTAWYNNQPNGLVYAGKVAYKYKGTMPNNTSVTLRDDCNGIADAAFNGCTGLTSVTIGNSVTTIGDYAFYYCNGLTSVTIPNSVTKIGDWAFCYCSGLTSVTIGNSVTTIGDYAFADCSGLTSVTIPNSVTSIGNSAFSGCTGLTSVSIPNLVTSIGKDTFKGCSGLTSVIIPNSVKSIGEDAFYGCSGLTSVHISDLEAWCNIYFGNGGANPLSRAHNLYLNGSRVTDLVIPNSVIAIKNYAFFNCKGLTSVTIGNSVTMIGNEAFKGCTRLTSLTIGNSVTEISDLAFNGCTILKSVILNCNSIVSKVYSSTNNISSIFGSQVQEYIIGEDVTSIGGYAFSGCTSLTSVTIGNSVTWIGDAAFLGCRSLASIPIPNSVTSIGGNAFGNTAWYNNQPNGLVYAGKVAYKYKGTMPNNTSITLRDDCKGIAVFAFTDCTSLTSIIIGNSVTWIGLRAFYGCTGLTSLIIPNSVTEIGGSAFSNCTGLTSMTIGNSVTTIGDYAFAGCSGLTSVTIPNSVTSIGWQAFDCCSGLTSVTIPGSVTSISSQAFFRCTNLNNIYCYIENPNNVTLGNEVFYGVDKLTCILNVPAISLSLYQSAYQWEDFLNIQPIPEILATSITLNKSQCYLEIGETERLTATVLPTNAYTVLNWTSNNTSVATVDQNGTVTAKTIGTAKITVTTTDGTNLSASCEVTVIPLYDLYPTTTELTHVRGQSNFSAVIPFWMSNKTAISGLQFDITLPTGVSFATVDDYPDVWLDANRKARNHTVDVSLISGSKYRVLVSSPTNNTFKGNEGVVLYMRLNVDSAHPIGSYFINTSNVIFVEPDETQHTGYNKSVKIDYKYLLGDADGDARVDVSDYTVTALYILNRPTEVFYSDAANVSGDNGINVTDLVGITNISLGIRPHEYRPAPAVTMDNDTQESMPSLNASLEGDNIVALSIDNDTPLAGMQLDLQIPQGMTLADATLEGRAAEYQLGDNTLADGSVRLLISSFGDKDIEAGNDAVIKLVLEGDNVNNEMLYITGAQAASRDLRSYELNDVTLPVGTTSIDDIGYSYDKLSIYGKGNTIVVNSPSAMTVQLVHVNGMVMPVEIKPGHNTIEVGGHGVYIIRVGNSAYKVRL